MTTAHRPTFDPAQGKEALRGPAYHQRLLPAHTHLKIRRQGQGGAADSTQRDLRAELLKAEAVARAKRRGEALPEGEDETDSIADSERAVAAGEKRKAIEGAHPEDADSDSEEDADAKRRRLILEEAQELDADEDSEEDSEEDSSDEDDDEDEEAALMRELAKVKAEKAAKRAAEEAELAKEEEDRREVEIARGNPLLNKPDFGVKRRWDDDVVFKNQARGTEEKNKPREFVNDLLRSDFHKRFMSKYVR